jgi:hypothetical protein
LGIAIRSNGGRLLMKASYEIQSWFLAHGIDKVHAPTTRQKENMPNPLAG